VVECARAGKIEASPHGIVEVSEHLTCLVPLHYYGQVKGNVVIVPNRHCENIYDIDETLGGPLLAMSTRVAVGMKRAFACTGVSFRQHNEPDGDQDTWHYHLHVFPRFRGDKLYAGEKNRYDQAERLALAARLRDALRDGGAAVSVAG
jgi:histidine triad (HIT) family protein